MKSKRTAATRRSILKKSAAAAVVGSAAIAIAAPPRPTGPPSLPKPAPPAGKQLPKPGVAPRPAKPPINPTPTPTPVTPPTQTVAGPFTYTPFELPLLIPPDLQPVGIGTSPYTPGDCFHGIAPEYFDRRTAEAPNMNWYESGPTKFYEVRMQEGFHEFIPGVKTPIHGYNGITPGPTLRTRVGQPVVVRFWNDLHVETSIHLHGAHTPSHSDGSPHFYVLPGRARDYYYPLSVPMLHGQPDFTESPSTMWYHDHGLDITDHNVWAGMCGFCLTVDDIEQDLIDRNVLPSAAYDIPFCMQDRAFNADGTMAFDPLDFNGHLGNVWLVNGVAQPFLKVQRRKYRFRILNGCNARFMELKLSHGAPFLRIGKDTWLYPKPIEQDTMLMSPANRADVIIDFTDAPNEVYLQNLLQQDNGRGPNGSYTQRVHLDVPVSFMKFIVEGPPQPDSATVDLTTQLRPHEVIDPAEAVVTRTFDFHRSNGAWQINNVFYDTARADATPTLGSVEKWILRNNSGGWWHPIHIHLESHQLLKFNGGAVPLEFAFKNDTTYLTGNGTAEILMRFRTFKGPFVFHCHNNAHEDMRMMMNMDPRVTPTASPTLVQASFP
jgi:FtsP/CotA-like multicopper oxidase with cupredoxin domain